MNKSYIIRFSLVEYYENMEKKQLHAKEFIVEQEAARIDTILAKAIKTKRKAMNAIVLSIVFDSNITNHVRRNEIPPNYADTLSHALEKHTLYKNVWLKIYDVEGKPIYRSWIKEQSLDSLFDDNAQELLKKKKLLNFIDIDHFKRINDKYGHDVSDKVLVEYSKLIQEHIREPDILCRAGGEEFVVILPETTLNDAVRVARKINKIVKQHKKVVEITVSLGVVEYIKGESEKDIYKRADNALYRAKANGRDKVVIG